MVLIYRFFFFIYIYIFSWFRIKWVVITGVDFEKGYSYHGKVLWPTRLPCFVLIKGNIKKSPKRLKKLSFVNNSFLKPSLKQQSLSELLHNPRVLQQPRVYYLITISLHPPPFQQYYIFLQSPSLHCNIGAQIPRAVLQKQGQATSITSLVYSAQYAVDSKQSIVRTVKCTVYSKQCTVYSVQ